jgi:hypothetical protein
LSDKPAFGGRLSTQKVVTTKLNPVPVEGKGALEGAPEAAPRK